MAYVQKRKLPKKALQIESEKATKKQRRTVEAETPTNAVTPESPDDDVVMPMESLESSEEKESASEAADAASNADAAEEELSADAHDLSSIYGLDDEQPVDMTKLEQRHSRGRWIAGLCVVLVLLGAVVYLGYRVFRDGTPRTGEVEITMTAESHVASGDVVTIEISYINGKNVDITSGDIEVFYPDGFHFQSATPKTVDNHQRSWRIEDVKPGAGGKIRIVGQLVGEKDSVKDFSALFTYRPSNFSQDFQESAKTSVTITSSTVGINVEAPSQVAAGQEMVYTVSYTNTSKVPLQNVKLLMTYPEAFTFTSASQTPWSGNAEWRIDTLQPNEKQTLTIAGSLGGESGETAEFNFQLGVTEIDNSFHVQVSQTTEVIIVNPEVELTITAPTIVQPGDEVPIEVIVKNASDAELREVDVVLSFTGALFRETEYTFEQIKKISPQDEKKLQTTVQLAKTADATNQSLEVVAKVTSARVNGASVTFPDQATAELKVGGKLTFESFGQYYDEDLHKVGAGPLPPTVGEKTTYSIVWSVTHDQNDLKNVSITTTLPDHVEWEDDASSEVAFDPDTRRVQYTASTLEAGDEVTLSFAVSVTPKSSDVDSLLVLTKETVLTAMDAFTEVQLSEERSRITSDLPNDEGASGKGVVER